MPFNRTEVESVAASLKRALVLDAKASRVEVANALDVDDDDDLKITNQAQVTAYIASRRNIRDAIIAAIKPTVSGW